MQEGRARGVGCFQPSGCEGRCCSFCSMIHMGLGDVCLSFAFSHANFISDSEPDLKVFTIIYNGKQCQIINSTMMIEHVNYNM